MRKLAAKAWRALAPDIVVQRRIHDTLYTLSLRDHALWIIGGDKADAESLPLPKGGHVWDLGCNIGLYSVQAAKLGCKVNAFDISLTNVLCLRDTAHNNSLPITAIHSPVTVSQTNWTPASTAHAEESLRSGGCLSSLTYAIAALRYGLPSFIKMDIQGGEVEFLRSQVFKRWLRDNQITLYIEVHGDAAKYVWHDMKQIGPIHYLFTP
jgi:FkbM family methyltransferase